VRLTPCSCACLIINFAFTAKRLLDFVSRSRYPLSPHHRIPTNPSPEKPQAESNLPQSSNLFPQLHKSNRNLCFGACHEWAKQAKRPEKTKTKATNSCSLIFPGPSRQCDKVYPSAAPKYQSIVCLSPKSFTCSAGYVTHIYS